MVSMARGAIEQTGRPLDLTLQQEGYLVADEGGSQVLIKSVSAHLANDGTFRDSSGRRLVLAAGDSRVDPGRPLEIGNEGQILQEGREVARFLVVDVADPRALRPVGSGAYVPSELSGQAYPVSARVLSGSLEKSNVDPVANMVRMIALERDFQTITRVISAYREADEGIIGAAMDS